MINEKWNAIWKIMKNPRLEFFNKCTNDMFCIICHNVLINAQFGPCGCRYCLECITIYLNDEEKICPGNMDDCKEELLKLNRDIQTDQPINRKIVQMTVKCPEQQCEFKDELRFLEKHLKICKSRSNDSPNSHMGCKESSLNGTDLKSLVSLEVVSHSKMMIELIDNLQNEIKILRDENSSIKKDNNDLKKSIEEVHFRTKLFVKLPDNLENELKILKEENHNAKKVNEDLKKSLNELKVKYKNETVEIKAKLKVIENKFLEEQKSVNDLQLKIERENEELKQRLKEIENKVVEEQKTSKKVEAICKIIGDFKSNFNKNNESITSLENQMNVFEKSQEKQNCSEFIWCIDHWKSKHERARSKVETFIDSNVFYSHRNGYKMCIRVFPNGLNSGEGTHLSIFFCLIQSEFDDILSWPFTLDVTLELVNQHTKQFHSSQTIKYDLCPVNLLYLYHKPNDKTCVGGSQKFISLKELSSNLALIDNDKMYIKCRVKID